MAFVDMAHSHVQRLLREACEVDEVKQDEDGDYAFRHGTAAWFAFSKTSSARFSIARAHSRTTRIGLFSRRS